MAKDTTKTARTIEDLKIEYETLNERKIEAQSLFKEATKQLEKLQKEAVEEFETSDIGELKTKLEKMEAENEDRRAQYQELLEGISADLEKVEKEVAAEPKSETNDDA